MTTIRKGDRVKATSKTNEDSAEFTVESVHGQALSSAQNYYLESDFDFEVIAPALPTQPGLYTVHEKDTPLNNLCRLVLTTKGVWHWLDFTSCGSLRRVEDFDDLDPRTLTLVYGGAQ